MGKRRGHGQKRSSSERVVALHATDGANALRLAEMTRSSDPNFAYAKRSGTLGPNMGLLPKNQGSQPQYAQGWPNMSPSGHPYPDMPTISDTQPPLYSLGASGTAIFSGIITSEEYNPDFFWRDGIKIYEQMLRNDGQIKAVREQVEQPLRSATWTIEPASDDEADKEIASFVESCLFEDMEYETSAGRKLCQRWDDILRHILMHLWYGFMAFEVNYRVEDGWVKWSRWTPLLPRTVWRWWVGEDNELVGIQQWTFKDYTYQFVSIPADKLLLFTNRMEGNNYEGVSELRNAYKHYFYKENFEKIEAIGIERNAVVPPVIYLPKGFTAADLSAAQTIVQNLRVSAQGGVTLPPRELGWELEYPKNMQRYAMMVQPSIQYHDVMIARSMLAQFLNLGSTETGAYNLNDSQLDSFRSTLQAKAHYIEDTINYEIQRLVDYNFDGVAVHPKIKCSRIQLQDLTRLATILQQLTVYLPPSQEMSDWLADELGIPVAPGSVISTTNPGSPNTPDRPPTQPDDHDTQESTPQGTRNSESDGNPEDAAAQDADGGGPGAGAMAEATGEVRLLREALQMVAGLDVVERGLQFGYNPYRDGHGKFAPGPHAEREGEGGGGGGGHGHGGGEHAGRAGGGNRGRSGNAEGEGKTKGSGRATKAEREAAAKAQVEAGYRDWASGRAYVQNGNYRLKNVDAEGFQTHGSTSAPWNKAVKAAHPTTDDFHRAAMDYAGRNPVEHVKSGMGRPVETARAGHAQVEAEHAAAVAKRGGSGARTPEEAHAEQVAKAEESVRKAQARADEAHRVWLEHPLIQSRMRQDEAARRALQTAKTRLNNLRAANPSQSPAERAAHAKSAQFEAKIAKARSDLAKLESDYAAHKAQHGLLSEGNANDPEGERLLAAIEWIRRQITQMEAATGEE